jgi:hypothetical protein
MDGKRNLRNKLGGHGDRSKHQYGHKVQGNRPRYGRHKAPWRRLRHL